MNKKTGNRILINYLFPFIVILLLSSFLLPYTFTFQRNTDEGINLIKVFLIDKGYTLYSQIWTDQPPLFSYLLWGWMKIGGFEVPWARCLIILFSVIFVWGLYQILRLTSGVWGAIVATFMMVFSLYYLDLSVSVMIGLPALTFGCLSILTILAYKKYYKDWLIYLSAMFLVLGLLTKFNVAIIVPIVILLILGKGIVTDDFNRNKIIVTKWTIAFFAIFVLLAILFFNADAYKQLFGTHISAKEVFPKPKLIDIFLWWFKDDWDILFFALIGTILSVWRKNRIGCVVLLWITLTYVILANHSPFWYHHHILLSFPLCWSVGIGINEIVKYISSKSGTLRKIFLNILLAFFVLVPIAITSSQKARRAKGILVNYMPKKVETLVSVLKQHSEETRWIVTDDPMIAFYIKKPVPPYLCVMSWKRFVSTRDLTEEKTVAILEKYKPEQILFLENPIKPVKLLCVPKEYLDQNYNKIFQMSDSKIYLRKDLE